MVGIRSISKTGRLAILEEADVVSRRPPAKGHQVGETLVGRARYAQSHKQEDHPAKGED